MIIDSHINNSTPHASDMLCQEESNGGHLDLIALVNVYLCVNLTQDQILLFRCVILELFEIFRHWTVHCPLGHLWCPKQIDHETNRIQIDAEIQVVSEQFVSVLNLVLDQ